MANDVIKRLDEAQDRRYLTQDEFQLRKDLKAHVRGLAAVERSRCQQASRVVWLREGDACTHFFHLKANGRKRKNFIHCLKNDGSNYVWLHEEKIHLLFNHFHIILGTKEQ
jgi:hypothetical protein